MDDLAARRRHGPARIPPEEPEGRRGCGPCWRRRPKQFGWGKAKPAAGHGFGLGVRHREGQLRGHLRRGRGGRASGKVRVVRAVTAFECGAVLNPDHLKNQVEGAVDDGPGRGAVRADRVRRRQDPEPALLRLPRAAVQRRCRCSRRCCSTARTCRRRGPARRRSSASPRRSATRSSRRPGTRAAVDADGPGRPQAGVIAVNGDAIAEGARGRSWDLDASPRGVNVTLLCYRVAANGRQLETS